MTDVYVLDANHELVSALPDVLGFTSRSRATRGGSFTLDTYWTPESDLLLTVPGAEIYVETGGLVFSGPVTSWSAEVDADNGHVITFDGIDHLGRLGWRYTDPEPGTAAPPYSTNAYSTYTGDVATVIADMVDDRCGAAALSAREFLTVVAPAASGPTVTVNLRFRRTLAEVVEELAVAHDMTVAVTINASQNLEFTVTPAPTRTNAPIGPDIGIVDGWEASASAPEATTMICGGQGELTARTFSLRSLAADARWPWRVEGYNEHTEATSQAQLDDACDRELAERVGQVSFKIDAAAYESDTVRFGRDFFLGDIVPLRMGGTETLTRVTEAETRIDADGVTRTLTIGVPPAAGVAMAVAESRRANRQARNQQGA